LATTSARTAAGSNRTKAESALTRSSCDAESNFVVSLGSMNLRGKAARCAALRCAALRCAALHCTALRDPSAMGWQRAVQFKRQNPLWRTTEVLVRP
jgi:hypothetical protein